MEFFRRLILAAVLSGTVAGLAYAAIQQWRVVPLILEAELYEGEGHSHAHEAVPHAHEDGTVHEHENAEPAEPAEPWSPADGIERTAYTVLATTLAGIGFALVFGAVSVLTGIAITPANGVIWGLAGFLAFSMAPAFGLPPELPGIPAADLVTRQVWWWGTALATALAIFAIARFRTPLVIAGAIIVVALPHLIGAPATPEEHSAVPAHLATAFAASALAASMVFWLITGTLLGWLNQRFGIGELT